MRLQLIVAFSLILCGCAPDDHSAAVDADTQEAVAASPAERAGDESVATPITKVAPAAEVIGQDVAYGTTADRNLKGYLVLPADVTQPVPGVIMIHERWGLNDTIRAMARRLAGEGFAVLAIDLYDGRTAATAAEAEDLMAESSRDGSAVLDNIRQAYDYLDEAVLAPRIATLGWSLGGGWSLEAGLALGDRLAAVVMFYGQVINDDEQLAPLEAPLLGHFGDRDESIPVGDVERFRRRLRDLGKDAQVLIYSDVGHAFANPSADSYNQEAAEQAWNATVDFLAARMR
jgi:carboxymethylenebutenolidase